MRIRSRPKRQGRRAQLLVAAAPITVFPPWLAGKEACRFRCWVVRVWEPTAPRQGEPIEWILLCSEPVEDLRAALRVAEWYSCRWLIEEYHKCLKTGCRVEARQLEQAARLEALVGIASVVAARLLQLKCQVRADPARTARECVSSEQLRILAGYFNRPSADMSVCDFWRGVARLGGFLGRKSDGEPGWQALWHGWEKLELMVLVANLPLPHT